MGSIAAAIAAGQAYRQQYPNAAPVPEPTPQNLVQPVVSPLPPNGATGLPTRGVFPANIVLASDRSNNTQEFRTSNMRSPTFPYPPTIQPTKTTVETTVSESSGGTTLTVEVNNLKTPSQKLLNFLNTPGVVWTAGPNGQLYATVNSTTDGLTHGQLPWEGDPSFIEWRDDFYFNTANTATIIGELGWLFKFTAGQANGAQFGSLTGGMNLGIFQIGLTSSACTTPNVLSLGTISYDNADTSLTPMALLDNPGWQMTWVFCLSRQTISGSGFQNAAAFDSGHQSMYIGLTNHYPSDPTLRPTEFVGLRYDTDPGITYTLTSVANHSGNTTVYTGTFANGASTWAGYQFTISGFTNAANNGTFTCTTANTTSITLLNNAGVAETHAATATTPAISDTDFTFEAVFNPMPAAATNARNNVQGTTVSTGVAPTEFGWHRFVMTCVQSGVVMMQLDNGPIATFTLVAPTLTGSAGLNVVTSNGITEITFTGTAYLGVGDYSVWAGGSQITVAGTGIPAGASGTFSCLGSVVGGVFFKPSSGTPSGIPSSLTITGFPAMIPYASYSTDSSGTNTANARALNIDFFSFVKNGSTLSTGQTTIPGNSRFF